MTSADDKKLKFVPFTSYLDVGFLHKFTKNKLEIYGLDDAALPINGFYSNGDAAGLPARITVDYTALKAKPETPPKCFTAPGTIFNKNTLESFKTCDKKELINSAGKKVWEDIKLGKAEENPELLVPFILLMFADMKKYNYYYWFAFPALCCPDNTIVEKCIRLDESDLKIKIPQVLDAIDSFDDSGGKSFFLAVVEDEVISIHPIREFVSLFMSGKKVLLGFTDPSTMSTNPGWPLRNLIALAAVKWSHLTKTFDILCLRDRVRDGERSASSSLLLTITLVTDKAFDDVPATVGWEKNERQKLGPRKMNLSSSMDPLKLAESSVDLNLKLMKWRLVPTLDLERIAKTKCLLLGSGTLGCNVARSLLGWGIKNITLVDNGKVSYSNPVRQTLFKFRDCLNGGLPKAETAAEALKEIFPGVNSAGVTLSIPMPGHFVDEKDEDEIRNDCQRLEALIDSHDVVFLLMDTRESRWLPTVIAAAKSKLVINAALGFDTFLVIRHGLRSGATADELVDKSRVLTDGIIPGSALGCYFCNDVVAPGDSTKDRTLDQQCTVTRPGVSLLASALAVEIMVSLVHQPEGGNTPAVSSAHDDNLSEELSTVLGIVPHQVRGFLSRFYVVLPANTAFIQCTACSDKVVNAYKEEGWQFLLKVFNKPTYLEDLTGLTELHADTQLAEVWELSDDDSDVQ